MIHQLIKGYIDGQILVVFISLVCLLFSGKVSAQETEYSSTEFEETKKMDAILVIDNSLSMDFKGHDPEGNRFEGAKIFIDKCEESDNIALVDFSSSTILLLPLTKVTKGRKTVIKEVVSTVRSDRKLTDIYSALEVALQELRSNSVNPLHIPVVVLLTDGETDVIDGTPEQKHKAAKLSEKMLLSKLLPAYQENYVPIYTIALKNAIDTSLLQILAEKSKLPEQLNEQHYFHVSPGIDLINSFSKIISQIKKKPRVAEKFHFTGEPIEKTTTTIPLTKKIGFEVLLGHREGMNIALRNPKDEIVEPTSFGKKYNFYEVDKPQPGQWKVSIEGEGENEVILAMFRDEEITINLPFPIRFQLGDKILIFANVKYKGSIVNSSTVIELSGRKRMFSIKQLLLLIHRPDGRTEGPFGLEKQMGSYTYSYENADIVGKYTLNFKLIGDIEGKEIQIEAQKEISVFQGVGRPVVSFEKLKEKYTPLSPIELKIVVKKNAELMQHSSIKVKAHSPRGSKALSIPRRNLALYSLTFTETEKEGEYTFTIEESEDYEAIETQQIVSITPLSIFPLRLLLTILIVVFTTVGLGAAAIKLRKWILAMKSRLLVKEFQEKTQPEIIKDVGTTFAMPDEILLWEDFTAVEQIYFLKQEGICSLTCAVGNNVILNDLILSKSEKATLNNGDVIRVNGLGFKVGLAEDKPASVLLYYLEGVMIKIYRTVEKVAWLVKKIATRALLVGDVIPMNFIKGDILYVGQDEGMEFPKPNDISIPHPSVTPRQISIRKDNSSNCFLTALDGKTVVNGHPLRREDKWRLRNNDAIKIGDFVFSFVILDDKPHLKLVEYHD